jgi:hypothetical protein
MRTPAAGAAPAAPTEILTPAGRPEHTRAATHGGSATATAEPRDSVSCTVVLNGGQTIHLGDPADPNNPFASVFFFADCHQHYHIDGFADYSLRAANGKTVAAQGHKQAFSSAP